MTAANNESETHQLRKETAAKAVWLTEGSALPLQP